jgi:hypothetical protein
MVISLTYCLHYPMSPLQIRRNRCYTKNIHGIPPKGSLAIAIKIATNAIGEIQMISFTIVKVSTMLTPIMLGEDAFR